MFGGVQGVEQQGKSQLRFSIHQRKGPSCQRWPEPRQVSTSQEKHCYVTMIDTAASHRGMCAVLSPKVFKCHVKSCWHFLNLFSTRLNPDCHCMPPSVSIIRRLPPKLFFGAKKVSLSTFFSWTFLAASITSSINQIPWNTNSGVGGFCLGVQSPEPFLDQLRTPSWPRDAGKAWHSL